MTKISFDPSLNEENYHNNICHEKKKKKLHTKPKFEFC